MHAGESRAVLWAKAAALRQRQLSAAGDGSAAEAASLTKSIHKRVQKTQAVLAAVHGQPQHAAMLQWGLPVV